MYVEIVKLEAALNTLLPAKQRYHRPGKELLRTAGKWSEEVWKAAKKAGPLQLSTEQIAKGKKLAMQPVFIFGVHRTGTTLLRDMLDNHPMLSVLPSEGTFFTNAVVHLDRIPEEKHAAFLGMEWLRRLANPINQAPFWLLGRSDEQHSPYIEFARAFNAWYTICEKNFKSAATMWPHFALVLAYATVTDGLDAEYWVDKTPANERHLQKLWADTPDAKIIHMVRSPEEILLSRKGMEHGLNIRRVLSELKLSYQTALENQHSPNYMLIRYKELCDHPEIVMARVTAFLGIDLTPELLKPTVAGKSAQMNSSFSVDQPAGTVVKTKSRSHNKSLSALNNKSISAYLFEEATQLGFDVKSISAIGSAWVRFKLQFQRASGKLKRRGDKKQN